VVRGLPLGVAPVICGDCGCSEAQPCLDEQSEPCFWIRPGLCSTCAFAGSGGVPLPSLPDLDLPGPGGAYSDDSVDDDEDEIDLGARFDRALDGAPRKVPAYRSALAPRRIA
jgi:hypothetical protein